MRKPSISRSKTVICQKKEEKSSPPKESSKVSPNPYIDYTKPFKLLDEEDETPWDNDE